MLNPGSLPHPNHSDWQLLTEILVSNPQEAEAEIVDQVAEVLRQFSLDPGQLDQILSAVGYSLESLEERWTPLRLRISVSGLGLAEVGQETYLQGSLEQGQVSSHTGSGLGLFLVKRIVSQLRGQDQQRYRLVEVVLYRE